MLGHCQHAIPSRLPYAVPLCCSTAVPSWSPALSSPAPPVWCSSPSDGVPLQRDVCRKEQRVSKSARNLISLACIFPSGVHPTLLKSRPFRRPELDAFVPKKHHCTKSLKLTGIQPAEGMSSHCHALQCPSPKKLFGGKKTYAGWGPSPPWWHREQVLAHSSVKCRAFLHALAQPGM